MEFKKEKLTDTENKLVVASPDFIDPPVTEVGLKIKQKVALPALKYGF